MIGGEQRFEGAAEQFLGRGAEVELDAPADLEDGEVRLIES